MKKASSQLTSFEKRVLRITSTIPFGETRSYAWVAKKVGKPNAVRAVGQALNKNPFLILIPCHRVIHKDGRLGGYALGINMKRALLSAEKDISRLCGK